MSITEWTQYYCLICLDFQFQVEFIEPANILAPAVFSWLSTGCNLCSWAFFPVWPRIWTCAKIYFYNTCEQPNRSHAWPNTHPCGLRSRESSMLCWKLGEPRSGVALLADVVDAVLMVVVHKLAVPLGQAFGGLVTRKLSDSERFFTWCITPWRERRKTLHAL